MLQRYELGPIRDRIVVAAIIQSIEQADAEGLREIGRRMRHEQLAECDREAVRVVYRQRKREIQS